MMLYIYILAGVFGLCVGSFLNVVIYRLPNDMSLAKPGSHCPDCGYMLRWYDNIPIFSYIILGGKCRSCKKHISFRYTAVEILNTLLWLASVWVFWNKSIMFAVISALVCSLLICLAFIDLENMCVPDILLWLFAACGAVALFSVDGILWYERLIGGVVGITAFGVVYFVAKLILKREGMGTGDILFTGCAGLLLGWRGLIFAILVSCVVGSIILLTLRFVRKNKDDTEYPFVPFLAFGTAVSMFTCDAVLTWYLALFNM